MQHHSTQDREKQKRHRKALRKSMTPAEVALWTLLRRRQLGGRRFRRQHSAGPYILDFYCPEEKLAIELDGEGHNNPVNRAYDAHRTASLKACGIRVLRFENRAVFDNPEQVLEAISWHFEQSHVE